MCALSERELVPRHDAWPSRIYTGATIRWQYSWDGSANL